MPAFRGDLSEYREFEPGRWRREDAGGGWIAEDGVTTVREGLTFADIYECRANPPAPEPDPLAAEVAELKAAVAALKKRGVLTDAMVEAEVAGLRKAGAASIVAVPLAPAEPSDDRLQPRPSADPAALPPDPAAP